MADQMDQGNARLSDDVINDELTALSRAALKPGTDDPRDAGSVSINLNDARLETLQSPQRQEPAPSPTPPRPEGGVGSGSGSDLFAAAAADADPAIELRDFGASPTVVSGVGTGADWQPTDGADAGTVYRSAGIDVGSSGIQGDQASRVSPVDSGAAISGAAISGAPVSGAPVSGDAVSGTTDIPVQSGPQSGPVAPEQSSLVVPDQTVSGPVSGPVEVEPAGPSSPAEPPGGTAPAAPVLRVFNDSPDIAAPPSPTDAPSGIPATMLPGVGAISAFTASVEGPATFAAPSMTISDFTTATVSISDMPAWTPVALTGPGAPGALLSLDDDPISGDLAPAGLSAPAAVDGPPAIGDLVQLSLPEAPVPVDFRPALNATSGLIVYDSSGDMINPPDESEMWQYLDPFGGERSRVNPEYINGTKKINNLTLEQDHPVSVTFIGEGAGHKNSLGYYKIAEDGTITDVAMIWENTSGAKKADVLKTWAEEGADADQLAAINRIYGGINQGGDLVAGHSTVELSNLSAGDSFGFFIVSNGYNNRGFKAALESGNGALSFVDNDGNPAKVSGDLTSAPRLTYNYTDDAGTARSGTVSNNIFHTAANDETLRLNSSNMQQVMSGVVGDDLGELDAWGVQSGELLIGFEDLARPGGDSDFNDLVFRLNVDPVFIENLETVSNSTDVTIGHGDDGDTIDRATVTLGNLDGAVFGFDGWNGSDAGGSVTVDGHEVRFRVDMSDADTAQILFTTDDLAPPAVFEAVLDSIAIAKFDADGDMVTAGDRVVSFQVSGAGGDSDIVTSVVRIAHNPDKAVTAPSPTITRLGPTNAEIAAENQAAMDAWRDDHARIEAANAEMAAAHDDATVALDAADIAHGAFVDAHHGLVGAIDAANDAIAQSDTAWDALVEAASTMEDAHAQALDLHGALVTAIDDHAAATSVADAMHGRLTAVHDSATRALGVIDDLRAEAAALHMSAIEAGDAYDAAVAVAQSAEAEARNRFEAVDAARSDADDAFAAARTARQAAEDKAEDIAQARLEATDLVAAATETHALIVATTSDLADQYAGIENLKSAAATLQDAARAAHEALAADPGQPDLTARYGQILEEYDDVQSSLGDAISVYDQGIADLEALKATFSEQQSAVSAAEVRITDLTAEHEDLASKATEAIAAYDDAADRFAVLETAYDTAAAEFSAARDGVASAHETATAAEGRFDEAEQAYLGAVDSFNTDVTPAFDAVLADFQDALAAVEAAADTAAEAQNAFTAAMDDFQSAQTDYNAAMDTFQSADEAVSSALDSVESAAGNADAAYDAYRVAMNDAAEATEAYAGLLDLHGTGGGTGDGGAGEASALTIAVPPATDAYKPATILGTPDASGAGEATAFADAPGAHSGGAGGADPADDLFTFDDGSDGGDGAFDFDPTFEDSGGSGGDGLFDCDPSGLETCV